MAPFLAKEYKELNKIGEPAIWGEAAGGIPAPGGAWHPSRLASALRMCLFCGASPSQHAAAHVSPKGIDVIGWIFDVCV